MSDGPTASGADGGAMSGVEELFDSVADVYDTVIDYFGRFGERLVQAARLGSGAKVLDLACGRGAVLRPALAAVSDTGSVLGIDVASNMVELLSADLAASGVANAEVRCGDAAHLALPDASFDAVTGGFMIFFPSDPLRVVAEVRRVLRPGGRLALSVFDGGAGFPFQSELEAAVGAAGRRVPGPGGRFNEASVLYAALEDAGFGGVETVEMRERFEFGSLEQVERWQRSTGVRRVLETLDDAQLAAYRNGLAARLERFRADPTGGAAFALDQRAVAVIADAPS